MTGRLLRILALGSLLNALLVFCATGQSLMSIRFPLGLPLHPESGSAMSMGGTNTGVAEDFRIMLGNPANLGVPDKVSFSSLFTLDGLRISDAGGHSNFIDFVPRQVSFALPIQPVGNIGFALALVADANTQFETNPVSLGLGLSGKTLLDIEGSLISWQLGWGRKLTDYLYAGLAYERVYYTRDVTLLSQLEETPVQSRDSTSLVFRGNGIRAGLLIPTGPVMTGIALEHVFSGDLEQSSGVFRGTTEELVPGSETSSTVTLDYPTTLSLGSSWAITPSWLAAGDFDITFWKGFDSHGLLPEPDINTVSLKLGGQFIPAPNLLNPQYWETIHYRGGLRFSTLPEDGSGEQALSLGAGFPIKGGGLADVVLEGGRRVSDRYDNYREYFISVGFGINGGRTLSRSSSLNNY